MNWNWNSRVIRPPFAFLLLSMDGARKQERETPMQRMRRLTQWLRDYKRVKQGIKSVLREY